MSNNSNAAQPNPLECLVCFCHGVSEGEIRQAIQKGSKTLLEIKEATAASTGCGGCTCEVERILLEMLAKK